MTEPVQYAAWYGTNASTVASALASATMPCPQPSVRWTARLYRNPIEHDFPDFADEGILTAQE